MVSAIVATSCFVDSNVSSPSPITSSDIRKNVHFSRPLCGWISSLSQRETQVGCGYGLSSLLRPNLEQHVIAVAEWRDVRDIVLFEPLVYITFFLHPRCYHSPIVFDEDKLLRFHIKRLQRARHPPER